MMKKYPRILFFIAAFVPTAEDYAEAEKLGPNVAFRNASMIPNSGCLEKCDGVAGQVPERYAETFPTAEDALNDWVRQRREAQEARLRPPEAEGDEGDEPKPQPKAPADKQAKAPATPKPAAAAVQWKPNTPAGN